MKRINFLLVVISVFFQATTAWSQENTRYEMNDHIVYYNVFNSTLITPEIAKAYQLIRGEDRVYLNVAVVKKSGGNGIPAKVSGVHRNLMQQQQDLDFIEIKEATATYYLAPIRFNNEEILHIDIQVAIENSNDTAKFTITKKLYRD